jgi:uncharacterized protein YcgI (DUF1989 family)
MYSQNEILSGRMARRAAQVRPYSPDVFEVREGDYLQITDLYGHQVSEMIAFNKNDLEEMISMSHTRAINNSLVFINGMTLYSNRRNPMFVMVEDTVGRHDILLPSCDRRRYQDDYGIEGREGCRDLFFKELKPYDIPFDRIPDPINFFMNVGLKARGQFEYRESLAERNDYVILRALMEMVVGVSACPQDQNASTDFQPTDILTRVYT